jgi:3-phosphoshikimate 1-carboxyvinyltransferase
MIVKINKSVANGILKAPPSKSYAHRLLISSSLSKENSTISNVELSNDIIATINCLKALGKKIEYNKDNKTVYISHEYNFNELNDEIILDAYESGSTYRFLIPISLLSGKKVIFKGTERLIQRGIGEYENIFKTQNIEIEKYSNYIILKGTLKPGIFELKGNISSQFITGLLFTLPLLNGDSKIILTTNLESKNYVDITIDVLKKSGIFITEIENGYEIKGNQIYKPLNMSVEGDHSNAAFLDAFNYIGGKLELNGLNEKSYQGDKVYKGFFEKLSKSYETIDISNCIDLGPILFCFASLMHGGHFVKTSRLKIKESNRIEAVKVELEKFGIEVIELEDEVFINNKNLHAPNDILYGQNDHRVVMSMSVMASYFGGTITGCEAVRKSYPNFFEDLKKVGIEVTYLD